MNRPLPLEARLARRLATAVAPARAACGVPMRVGTVRDSVLRALSGADRPMRAREIHAAAEVLAGFPLSWNTVKDYLHKQSRLPASPVRRVCHGVYERNRP